MNTYSLNIKKIGDMLEKETADLFRLAKATSGELDGYAWQPETDLQQSIYDILMQNSQSVPFGANVDLENMVIDLEVFIENKIAEELKRV